VTDTEKFEGLKQEMLKENERLYGAELREKYGDAAIEKSNARFNGMTKERYDESERLRKQVDETLAAAVAAGDPAGELAQKACALHAKWLAIFTPEYSKEYHRGLGEMYVLDERFKAYYDKLAPGCAEFLRDAINVYCKSQAQNKTR
jgi:hypothetical protein